MHLSSGDEPLSGSHKHKFNLCLVSTWLYISWMPEQSW